MLKKALIIVVIIILVSFVFLTITTLLPKPKYHISYDDWTRTEYVVMDYGKYLGQYWDNGPYDYYQIKGLDEDNWIYEANRPIIPMNTFSSCVYKSKDVSIDPIYDWEVDRIIISTKTERAKTRVNYITDTKIYDKEIIDSITDILKSNPYDVSKIENLKFIVNTHILLVFNEYPALAWKGSIWKDDNGRYYVSHDDKFYDIGVEISKYLE
ncbi:MAG: hypothetical protein A2Y17_06045 [Clostridiales bacterium GWF2_38_85]|nr:MAG: hypothetical protein A2Y17_06045 [Clostridiales bacterium GWF2_38_85]HBL83556.1 hypothetical protein [Clostridiales bacterium]